MASNILKKFKLPIFKVSAQIESRFTESGSESIDEDYSKISSVFNSIACEIL
jgi:hypothetical protein